ncbi:MAG TPA: hypothetical protein VJA21_26470 [Verrucomicrobiae bacterium]
MNRTTLTLLPVLLLCLFLEGCTSTYDFQAAQVAARPLDVYRNGKKPARQYNEIAVLKDNGRLDEQANIEAKMVQQAKTMAGDAIIFLPLVKSGSDAGSDLFTSTPKPTYLYQGSVVRYQ